MEPWSNCQWNPNVTSGIDQFLEDLQNENPPPRGRPWVTLSYAQSLDGCIALEQGKPTGISGEQSMRLTHRVRSEHDAILVGIGTILSDNPQLTVRLVEGRDPQVIVLDSGLRLPADARILNHPGRSPWLFVSPRAAPDRIQAVERLGGRVFCVETDGQGQVDLPQALARLADLGIQRLLVEGGAKVITSFLNAGLVDTLILTIAPVFMAGLHAYQARPAGVVEGSRLRGLHWESRGDDWLVWGKISGG
jgi:3,4-dihydroxy 2-butanone 4-phosphate synthase/GTP cyclohydrolase II